MERFFEKYLIRTTVLPAPHLPENWQALWEVFDPMHGEGAPPIANGKTDDHLSFNFIAEVGHGTAVTWILHRRGEGRIATYDSYN